MIRLAVTTIALIALTGLFVVAQDSTPKVQVFGGYSLVHADTGGLTGADVDFAVKAQNSPFQVESNFQGWNAEAQYNADRWLGIVVDIGGRRGTPITGSRGTALSGLPAGSGYSLLAGPVISYRSKSRITPFVHALFGFDRLSISASTISGVSPPVTSTATTYTDAALALGGGLDFRLSGRFALRLPQLDELYTTHNLDHFYESVFSPGLFNGRATHQHNLRISAGIVVRF